MMELWVSKAMAESVLLTGEVLHQKWARFADLAGVPQDECLNLCDGWLSCFKNWTGLKQFKCHGDAASADLETVKREKKCVQELINKYELQDIFNMDETRLFYAYVPYQFPSLKHIDFRNRLPQIEVYQTRNIWE
jgi:hypothetical protein